MPGFRMLLPLLPAASRPLSLSAALPARRRHIGRDANQGAVLAPWRLTADAADLFPFPPGERAACPLALAGTGVKCLLGRLVAGLSALSLPLSALTLRRPLRHCPLNACCARQQGNDQ